MENAIRVCKELLETRGYNIISETEEEIFASNDVEQILVFFVYKKFNIELLEEYLKRMYDKDVKHSIFVYEDVVTSLTKKMVLQNKQNLMELFAAEDLQINITKHRLQPKFRRLTIGENELFRKKYGTKHPIMRLDDPVARFYGYRRGDVIRIERSNGYVAYRFVH